MAFLHLLLEIIVIPKAAVTVPLLAALIYVFIVKYRPGLRQIPGPFLASFSPLDRIITAASGHQFSTHIKYHKRYGSLVRVGPNHVSFANAALIPQVYGITEKFVKVFWSFSI